VAPSALEFTSGGLTLFQYPLSCQLPAIPPVSTVPKRRLLSLLFLAAMTGCAGPGYVTEHPVNNPVPELKPGVYSVKTVDVPPAATREIEPDYPPELGSILTGKAVVLFTVRADGRVIDASVVEADDVLFGESALAAILKWRFQPARVRGAPVACRMTMPFVFDSPYGGNISDGGPGPAPSSPPNEAPGRTVEPR